MELFIRLDINIFATLILLILLLNSRASAGAGVKTNKIFGRLTGMVLIITVSEIISFAVDRQPGAIMPALNYVSNMLLFLLAPFTMGLWAEYVEHYLLREVPDLRRRRLIRGVPVVIILALVLINPFTGFLFKIFPGNVYERGPHFLLQILLNVFIVGQAYLTLLQNRQKMDSTKLLSLAAFPLLPLFGVMIQYYFYGTTMIWSSMALALLLIFLNVQKSLLLVDSLTGIDNRRSVDNLIESMSERRGDVLYGGMMLDIDNLKEVNDAYGHATGDLAIKRAAEIIKGALRSGDFVARYAGDEFFVVIEVGEPRALNRAVARIHEAFTDYNRTSGEPWEINVSIGFDTFRYESAESVDQAMRRIDELMYQEKKRRKLERRLAAEMGTEAEALAGAEA
ncbi:GGDEF domain-containing protein [Acidaminobacter hydrogenoformans]|uniref:Diguanylate cyclase (GGDEF) domain-containing protein n=1 Tax=Acidaminobacter hydrogenoformans DSM 2784 TaxID=1120920 RepID=A0A1G5RSR4_9FIRM|nr:GGDEF domain-containing protein [Acidaminobacter hydrogenoformans]SCZ76339.1 diguanylate cyclase (GGDEF) domain-containing protein [Acidaminobacter hydrogenoformans DSM 2784]